jgi:hypothetical protein
MLKHGMVVGINGMAELHSPHFPQLRSDDRPSRDANCELLHRAVLRHKKVSQPAYDTQQAEIK